jgi:hypothetical protein
LKYHTEYDDKEYDNVINHFDWDSTLVRMTGTWGR